MLDIEKLTATSTIKSSPDQTISVVENENGEKYIKRVIKDDKREIYKVLQKINHPSIPKIFHIEFDGSTTVYEQYFEGTPLLSESKEHFSKKTIKSIAKQLLSAMEKLHASHIIHRDIKPDNILIDKNGSIMLIDYDISRIFRPEMRKDTEQKGTFGYAPIEQYGMLPTDFRTDIYAFGVTLKEMLEVSGISNGYLYRICDKCRRLDPNQRYKNVAEIKRALSAAYTPWIVCCIATLLVVLVCTLLFFSNDSLDTKSSDSSINTEIEQQSETQTPETAHEDASQEPTENNPSEESHIDYDELKRFTNVEVTDNSTDYYLYDNYNTAQIFSGEEMWELLPFMQDITYRGDILLGKNRKTPVGFEMTLEDGIFYVSLYDSFGHTFEGEFSIDEKLNFDIEYPENRRINAEVMCRDLDGDNVEELLIGLCDCSMTTNNTSLFIYFNCSVGKVLKYNEANGFSLCSGEMISENAKFVFLPNDLRIHLPVYARNTDKCSGFVMKKDKILPFKV